MQGQLVSKNTLCEILGKTQAQVTTLIGEGLPIRQKAAKMGASHQFDTAAVINWLISRTQGGSLNAEKTRLAKHQADQKAIQNARLRGELVPANLVVRHCSSQSASIRSRLLLAPNRIRGRFPELEPEILDGIDTEIRDTLVDLSVSGIPEGLRSDLADYNESVSPAAQNDLEQVG